MSRPKRKGTAWETAIVAFLRANGYPDSDRIPLSGSKDRGDVAGIPRVTIEAKSVKTISLATFVDEANREAVNAGKAAGVAWIKRRGKVSPAHGYVVMDGETFLRLLQPS